LFYDLELVPPRPYTFFEAFFFEKVKTSSPLSSALLDLPTLVSFSMVSRSLRNLVQTNHMLWPCFDNFKFMDECSRLGYVELLRFAFESGCDVDENCLLVAIAHSQFPLIDWLRSIEKEVNRGREWSPEVILAAVEHGDVSLLQHFLLDRYPDYGFAELRHPFLLSIRNALATGGHVGPFNDMLQKFRDKGRDQDTNNKNRWPVFLAAKGGHLCAALQLDRVTQQDTWNVILVGGIIGGKIDVICAAIKGGARLQFKEELAHQTNLTEANLGAISVIQIPPRLDILDTLWAAYSGVMEGRRNEIFEKVVLSAPSVQHIKWLEGRNYFLPHDMLRKILRAKAAPDDYFGCIQYLHGKCFTYDYNLVSHALGWANYRQIRWIIEHASQHVHLFRALTRDWNRLYSGAVDPDELHFVLTNKPVMKNVNVQKLLATKRNVLYTNMIAAKGISLESQANKALHTFIKNIADRHVNYAITNSHSRSLKNRYHNATEVIKFLVYDQHALMSLSTKQLLADITNSYFQSQMVDVVKCVEARAKALAARQKQQAANKAKASANNPNKKAKPPNATNQ